jgi:phosphatidylethanolamine/phosphatidyl-N-methylethanolamine N-methyltransferase
MSSEMSKEGVAKSYDRLAPVYDLVFGPVFRKGRAESIKVAEKAAGKGGRILEIGVGTGISLPFYSKDTRLIGADISEDMLEVARKRVEKLGLTNVESIEVGDAENLRTDFPFALFTSWAAKHPGVRLIERKPLPPLGHFALLRFEKLRDNQAIAA